MLCVAIVTIMSKGSPAWKGQHNAYQCWTGLTCLAALLQEQQDAQSETSRQMNAFEVHRICLLGFCMLATPWSPDSDPDALEHCSHQLWPYHLHKLRFQHHNFFSRPNLHAASAADQCCSGHQCHF